MATYFSFFGEKWKSEHYTKWDDSRYDHAYFGPEGVKSFHIIDTKNKMDKEGIELSIVKIPMKFKYPEIYRNESEGCVTKEYCCGDLRGEFHEYGTYTWNVKMPEGKHLWPALWLWGPTWPPEIDLVEGYTDDRGNYIKNWLYTRLESNFHLRENFEKGTHKSIGAKGIPTLIYKLYHKKACDEFKCVWTPDYVKLYFNGHLFRTMKDKDFLADANKDHRMTPVMNMMIDNGFELDEENPPVMKIYNFKYEPLEN